MRITLRHWLIQGFFLLALSAVIALTINGARDDGICLTGKWPSRTGSSSEVVTPPSAIPGDPPFITLLDAVARYQLPEVTFIDSRSPEDFALAHIARSINIPYDYLDSSGQKVMASLDQRREYVIYCGGGECEGSLYLGRYLWGLEFKRISVFYGGWQEWTENNLPVSSGLK